MESRREMIKKVFVLAWPAFIELVLTQLTSLVDLAMIGNLGPWALSAVGFTTQPKLIMMTVLIISEYAMPDDFICIWQKTVRTLISSTKERGDAGNDRVEKLFRYKDGLEVVA